MIRILGILFTVLLIAGLAGPAVAEKWDMACGYPDSNYHTQNIQQFIADVKAATGGKLEVTLHSNQSLFKLPEIKRAVQSRQVPIGEILLVQFGNEDPLFEVSSIPFLADDYKKAKKLWDITKPLTAERLAKQGVRLLYGVVWPPQGIYAKTPVHSTADLKGVKFRTYNATTSRMAELMGAIPVTVQFSEVPQAFATGLVGAMYTSPQTGIDTRGRQPDDERGGRERERFHATARRRPGRGAGGCRQGGAARMEDERGHDRHPAQDAPGQGHDGHHAVARAPIPAREDRRHPD